MIIKKKRIYFCSLLEFKMLGFSIGPNCVFSHNDVVLLLSALAKPLNCQPSTPRPNFPATFRKASPSKIAIEGASIQSYGSIPRAYNHRASRGL